MAGAQLTLSPGAYDVQSAANLETPDDLSALEFAMAGYVTGRHTLIEGLYCLQPGELLIWKKGEESPTLSRYFRYIPDFTKESNWQDNEKKLGQILNDLTRKMIERAGGKTIWVPLSAGLDSRILLCKLHEHGYQNIQTFTYGPRFNFEAKYAKKIAAKLNVPWRMICPSRKALRAAFESGTRREFWRYADGLKTIPSMREYTTIQYLHDNKLAQEGDIFLNGQSGDYITGGHISPFNPEQTFEGIILKKHYAMWPSLLHEKNKKHLQRRIDEAVPNPNLSIEAKEEAWEYDARQITLVINGQRIYEFLGYEWEMPLWEKSLVDFCQILPLAQKRDQALYKSYLRAYNYQGLFPDKEPNIWRWPVPMPLGVTRGKADWPSRQAENKGQVLCAYALSWALR